MVDISKKISKEVTKKLHQDILTTVRQSYPGNGYQIVSVSAPVVMLMEHAWDLMKCKTLTCMRMLVSCANVMLVIT